MYKKFNFGCMGLFEWLWGKKNRFNQGAYITFKKTNLKNVSI